MMPSMLMTNDLLFGRNPSVRIGEDTKTNNGVGSG